jgi:CO/xanthine dehydrogenase FAD-binding subunit
MEYLRPKSVGEAAAVLASSRGRILAGGTDLCVQMAEGLCSPEALVDISGIDALRGIEVAKTGKNEGAIRIGACTTIAELAASNLLPTALRQGAQALGSPQIRNLGTIGGNICNASPCGDTLTPLLSLDARFVIRSSEGTRAVEAGAFFTGPKQTVLAPGDILELIELPAASRERLSAFRMIGNRRGQAISQVNAAVSLRIAKGRMSDVRVAVGSVAPIPLRLAKLEAFLIGRDLEELGLEDIAAPIQEGIRPIDDVRSSAAYRRKTTVALVFDALMDCAGQSSGGGKGAGGC